MNERNLFIEMDLNAATVAGAVAIEVGRQPAKLWK